MALSPLNARRWRNFKANRRAFWSLWVFLILIFLEGVLAADNACVMAVIVRVLPEAQRGRALFWGLAGAFVLRFSALFLISYLIDRWEIQAIGALYLLFLSLKHLYGRLEATTGTPGAESAPAGRVPEYRGTPRRPFTPPRTDLPASPEIFHDICQNALQLMSV